MSLENGERIHVVMRRRFEGDLRRHFVGEVENTHNDIVRATGYSFIFDATRNEWVRRGDPRTRLFSLADAGNIVTVLPLTMNLESTTYTEEDGRMVLTDGQSYSLDVHEFGMNR